MTPEQWAKRISQRYSLWGQPGRESLEYEIANAIDAALAHEREACAKVADEKAAHWRGLACDGMASTAEGVAEAIRARNDLS